MQKWKTFPGILGLVIVAALAAPARADGLTLRECLHAALAENPSLKESRLAVSASEQGVESAEGRRYPRLSLDASQVFRQDAFPYIPAQSMKIAPHFSDTFASWGPTLSVPLYQGGQIFQRDRTGEDPEGDPGTCRRPDEKRSDRRHREHVQQDPATHGIPGIGTCLGCVVGGAGAKREAPGERGQGGHGGPAESGGAACKRKATAPDPGGGPVDS